MPTMSPKKGSKWCTLQQWGRKLVSPHTWQHWLLSFFLSLIFAIVLVKNSTLSFYFQLLNLLVRLNFFMETHAYSKLPLEVFILPQLCSITRRNSCLNQPLFPPSKSLFGLPWPMWLLGWGIVPYPTRLRAQFPVRAHM